MSKLTRCNYCSYKQYLKLGYHKATQKEREKVFENLPGEDITNGGVVIVNQQGEFIAWFLELPNSCRC